MRHINTHVSIQQLFCFDTTLFHIFFTFADSVLVEESVLVEDFVFHDILLKKDCHRVVHQVFCVPHNLFNI